MTPIRNVLVIGGSGFVGSAIAERLTATGIRIVVPTRRRERARHLLLLPTAEVVEADIFDPTTLAGLMTGVDAVVNLVGVLHSRPGSPYGPDFARAHVDLPKRLVAAARQAGVQRIVHISALGASADGPSEYQRSKAAGAAEIRAAEPDVAWTILRPSVIFGPGDSFLNLFAGLLRRFPVLPLGGAGARFQPVYVEDVAEVVVEALQRSDAPGQTFDMAGPTQYSLQDLVEYVGELIGCPRPVIPLPEGLAMLQAGLLEMLPGPLMSRDNVRSMRAPNVSAGPAQPWSRVPTPLEVIAPMYLGKANKRCRYTAFQLHRP
ncbi:complex I NDUFA9 subunit family protein [Zoogloea sp.]|uniref:complex I NDUFA9 subunit family protein n=1 Tax=Zoogloea sp. TaxID=49181 RepID=UPI001ACCC521|nr:complex I NDUFA9 subunit family protein [Zoogloea sp.]MBN8282846.1 complex I NDUFA9 subunit family protein [Zoogloea sp.]